MSPAYSVYANGESSGFSQPGRSSAETLPSYSAVDSNRAVPQQQHELPPDLSLRLTNLKLGPTKSISVDYCIAHLKFLEAVQTLREQIANSEGIFGLVNPPAAGPKADEDNSATEEQLKIREKRWQVYVSRAVDRFEKWWNACVPASIDGNPCGKITTYELTHCGESRCKARTMDAHIAGNREELAGKIGLLPLDLLIVWHAYLLNPRCFLEDCIRYGKYDFYATDFPFDRIDGYISPTTFEYLPPDEAKKQFESATGLHWNNLDDPAVKGLNCSNCGTLVSVPWTENAGYAYSKSFAPGNGFADSGFTIQCPKCNTSIDHDYLRVMKFREDLLLLLKSHIPFPGTILNSDGKIKLSGNLTAVGADKNLYPCKIAKTLISDELIAATSPSGMALTMEGVKKEFEKGLIFASSRRSADKGENLAYRRMMSRYWYNSSPFALDLVGAVVRQGSFVEKMHRIDWLHSPALNATMERLIERYVRFMTIMAENPKQTCVPTLDIDLAWHTHQLAPRAYSVYTLDKTKKLVDHDDKIEESVLSDAFAKTSALYQARFGEPYSECNCWYCAAVREMHTSPLDRIFNKKKNKALEMVHDDNSTDPLKSPHISAHNAVQDTSADAIARRKVHDAKLDKEFHKAVARARKKGKKEPTRDDFYYAYAYGYGYPLMMPMYVPYYVDPCVAGGAAVYTADPCSVNSTAGGYGSCAVGTCSSMASAGGSCGAATGGCASAANPGAGAGGGCGTGSGGCGGGCGGGG